MDAGVAAILGALIGLAGAAIGAVVTILVARINDGADARRLRAEVDARHESHLLETRREAYVALLTEADNIRRWANVRAGALRHDRTPLGIDFDSASKSLRTARAVVLLVGPADVVEASGALYSATLEALANGQSVSPDELTAHAEAILARYHAFAAVANHDLRSAGLDESKLS